MELLKFALWANVANDALEKFSRKNCKELHDFVFHCRACKEWHGTAGSPQRISEILYFKSTRVKGYIKYGIVALVVSASVT